MLLINDNLRDMKPLTFLKTILDILLIFLIIGILLPFIFAIFHFSSSEELLPVVVNGQEIRRFNSLTYAIIILAFLSKGLFIYTVLKFRKLVHLFYKDEFFTASQIKETKLIGALMIITAAFNAVPVFIYKTFIEESPRRVSYNVGGFDSFWFILALGLFFIYLSRVFSNARMLKEENDLTV